jgi:hypothetical protein
MDARTVECHAGLLAGVLQVLPLAVAAVEPVERRHDVDPSLEDADQLRLVRHHRGVEDAFRAEREERLDVAGCGDAELLAPEQLTHVTALLALAVHPHPRELELGVGEHTLDRGAADAARCPLDHPIRHAGALLLDGSIP